MKKLWIRFESLRFISVSLLPAARLVLKHPFFLLKAPAGCDRVDKRRGGGGGGAEAYSLCSSDGFCWCDSPTRARLSRSPLHYNERCMARIKLTTDNIDVRLCDYGPHL